MFFDFCFLFVYRGFLFKDFPPLCSQPFLDPEQKGQFTFLRLYFTAKERDICLGTRDPSLGFILRYDDSVTQFCALNQINSKESNGGINCREGVL